MYFNNVHILYYLIIAVIGAIVGQFLSICNKQLPKHEKIFTKDSLKKIKSEFELDFVFISVMAFLYIALLYKFGINSEFNNNLLLLKNMALVPFLILIITIDYKHSIIPNRLNLTLFELGLIFSFIYGFTNVSITIDMFIGMFVGGGVFLLITLLGGLISGKEAMGFGDVKLMTALRSFLWVV